MRGKLAAAFVAALVGATITGTAHAAPRDVQRYEGQGPSACPTAYFCLYVNGSFNQGDPDAILRTDQDIPDLNTYGFNDVATTLYNNTAKTVTVWRNANYSGDSMVLPPGRSVDFSGTPEWNDSVSSVKFA